MFVAGRSLGLAAIALVAAVAVSLPAQAFDAGTRSDDAGADASVEASAPAVDPRVPEIRALLASTLDVAVDAQTLFDVPLDDERAVAVETLRIGALLRGLEDAGSPRAGARHHVDAGAIEPEDRDAFNERLALDRARLSFYALAPGRRQEILRAHVARQEAARPKESEEARKAREAEQERQRALESARLDRSEVERMVGEEVARLIEVESNVASVRDHFREARAKLAERKDVVLGWQRRVRDARAAQPAEADTTYDALRRTLQASRDELSAALDGMTSSASEVPVIGPDALADVSPEIPTDNVRDRRAAVSKEIADATRDERSLREERAAALLDEIATLNRERLGLLSHLSSDKQDAVTGYTAAGGEQARSEVRQVSLVLRYHFHVAQVWLGAPRQDTSTLASWRAGATAIGWSLLVALFVWGRRRTPLYFTIADTRLAEADRAEHRATPSGQRRAIRFLAKVHRPIEWGLFFIASRWLLPSGASALLEIQLLSSIIGWVLGAALVVDVINAFAAGAPGAPAREENASGELRLRSLRLIGRTVVVFALILMLSARLVGEGTIFSWVFSTCWFAAVPVFLVLVRWWRGVVFDRLERARRKSRLQAWILSSRSGWKSFIAAMLGAVQLFTLGTLRAVRTWLSGFDVARRADAYIFKRGLDRLGEGGKAASLRPMAMPTRDAFEPDRPYERWLPSPNELILDKLIARVAARNGGVLALSGTRGMGKSSLLRELARRTERVHVIACTPKTTLADVRVASEADGAGGRAQLVILDDAHTIVTPVIGGLERFDEVIAFARASSTEAVWVLAFDASLWPFVERARDATPLFEASHRMTPWNETEIGALLADRCAAAKITPLYDDLLDRLPTGADDVDRAEAIASKQAGYERMLWDHVRGNPGLALEAWRASLATDEAGAVHVRPLQVPDASMLERLPDSLLFVLRAVLQLAPAALDDVALATRLSRAQVIDAFRFAEMHGVFIKQGDRVAVSWEWLRPVVWLLERRHLLVNS